MIGALIGQRSGAAGRVVPVTLDLNGGQHAVTLPSAATGMRSFGIRTCMVTEELLDEGRYLFSTPGLSPGLCLEVVTTVGAHGLRLTQDDSKAADVAGGAITQGVPFDLVVTYAAGTVHFWINGVDVAVTYPFGAMPGAASWDGQDLLLGAPPPTVEIARTLRRFAGPMGGVDLFDHALTPTEVATWRAGGMVSGRLHAYYGGAADHRDRAGTAHGIPYPASAAGPRFTPKTITSPPAGGVKVGVVGDSLSEFSYGYMTQLQNFRYQRRGLLLNLVGSLGDAAVSGYTTGMPGPIVADRAHYHTAIGGAQIAAIRAQALLDIASYAPDVLIVRWGTNDIAQGASAATTRDRSIAGLSALLAARPGMPIIYLAPLRTLNGAYNPPEIEAYRGMSEAIVAGVGSALVDFVDTRDMQDYLGVAAYSGYIVDTTADGGGVHPMRELSAAEAWRIEAQLYARFPS